MYKRQLDHLHEPTGGGASVLRQDEPLEKSVRYAEGGEGNGILVDGSLVEGGNEVEREKYASFAQGAEDLIDAGGGELPEGAEGFQLLVVDGNAKASIILRDGDHWAGARGIGVLDETGGQELVEDSIRLLRDDRVQAMGALAGGRARAEAGLERIEKMSGSS